MLDGLRPGSRRAVEQNRHQLEALFGGDKGRAYQPDLTVYAPDPAHDRAAQLRAQLAAGRVADVRVFAPGDDGREEAMTFVATEAAAYLQGDFATQHAMRQRKIRERRLDVAIAAAARIREKTVPAARSRLTAEEELCLREYGALEDTTIAVAEGRGRKRTTVSREAIRVRSGWLATARRVRLSGEFALEPRAVREAYGYGFGDPDTAARSMGPPIGGMVGWGAGFERIRQYGPQYVQMFLSEVWQEQALCRATFERDVVCKQAVRISTNFIVGRGLSVIANDPQVQAVLDEFDTRHSQKTKKAWLRSAKVMGETFLQKVPLGGGRLQLRKMQAQTIWYVITLAEDVTVPIAFIQRYHTAYQPLSPDPNQMMQYVDRVLPADQVLHYKRNADTDEVRGRSDVFAAIPWHKRLRDYGDAEIEKAYAQSAYAYYAKVKGGSGNVAAFLRSVSERPMPGSWLAFNEQVDDIKVISADVKQTTGEGSINDFLLNILAMNYGFSKWYLGVSGNHTRGGQVVEQGPAEKTFEDDQDDYGAFLTQQYQAAIDEAKAWGLLDGVTDFGFSVQFPEIIKADSETKVQLLQTGRENGYVSHETASSVWASQLDMGTQYDYTQEQERIKAEAERGITLPGYPPTGAAPQDPGIDPGEDDDELEPMKTDPSFRNGRVGDRGGGDPRGARTQNAVRQDERAPSERAMERATRTLQRGGAVVVRM